MLNPATAHTTAPGFAELFTPKLVTVLREGYGRGQLATDALAGLTVAIVALPLSMAIAIASGVGPERGLYTAIVGGFFVSALGGSRFQIGGPAGAFIVLVAATVARHGIDGLLLAVFLSGLMMLAAGYLKLGSYIKFIPYPVTVGFTAGIAVIIFASQIRELFGLTLSGPEPGELIHKLPALAEAIGTISPAATGLAVLTIVTILGLRHFRPGWPGMLIAVGLASVAAWAFALPAETIGTRFGGIPSSLPWPALPDFSPAMVAAVLPDAAAFALLGAIESLLSAVVADGMTGRRHRSNCELVAQGYANIASSLFGGICVTGTIARTATNVRSGAHGPVSGMLHSLFILAFMLIAAPMAAYIPLAALAGVLVVVAWNMAERHQFAALLTASRTDAVVLLATFLLTIFRDLTEGIVVGSVIGAFVFIERMARTAAVQAGLPAPRLVDDRADGDAPKFDEALAHDRDIAVYRLGGAFFFGSAAAVGSVLDRIADQHKAFILDVSALAFLDSTAANALANAARKAQRRGVAVWIAGASPSIKADLASQGINGNSHVQFSDSVDEAAEAARAAIRQPE